MHPIVYGLILGLMLACIVIVVIINCKGMREDWQEKQPPRFCDYFWMTIESVLEFFS